MSTRVTIKNFKQDYILVYKTKESSKKILRSLY